MIGELEKKYIDFVAKVAKMRSFQKEYLRVRSSLDLAASKKAEKEVDTMIYQEIDKLKTIQKSIF